ncbi:hypothetical protein ACFOWM_08450 [Ferruginibacter yonginensis]|uniref:DUF4468 domain-containing protein n=1 Tax=Ferruginibacter yonginensis TaxID=1310416 RepID=A0ABV8QU39_9BACT
MKKFVLAFILIATTPVLFAQAYETQMEYSKVSQPAVAMEYKYPKETVEKSLTDKVERMGFKLKSSKGFLVASNAIIGSISPSAQDYIFDISRKSKKEKDITIVTLIINSNGSNATTINAASAKSFLAEMLPTIEALHTDNLVNDQFEVVTKAQKKLKNLQDDQSSMEKKIKNLQDDLSKNAKDQADQQKEIIKQQEILDVLKAKKTNP